MKQAAPIVPMRCHYCDRYCGGDCGLARRARREELELVVEDWLVVLLLAAGGVLIGIAVALFA